jgi:pyridoxal 5'-phosphate synthase pdxT subunit
MAMTILRTHVGVLALQGAFRAHSDALSALGAQVSEVRTPDDLVGLDAVVLPGGESTTMSRLLNTSGLREPLGQVLHAGLPALATCAGLILLARTVLDGRPDQQSFGVLDVTVQRNAYGRQVDSFETDLTVTGLEGTFHAVFIRAPVIVAAGPNVEVLAQHDDTPVLVRQGRHVAMSFHPELAGDHRLHALFLQEV